MKRIDFVSVFVVLGVVAAGGFASQRCIRGFLASGGATVVLLAVGVIRDRRRLGL